MIYYLLVAYIFYAFNTRMGSITTGVIAALGWPITVGLWIGGSILVWMESRTLRKIIRREE